MRTCILTFCFVLWGLSSFAQASDSVSFRSVIAPILLDHCAACHGAKKSEGGYRVDTYDELLKPGDSGETPIAQAAEEVCEVLRRITAADQSERMPAESEPLQPEQIELIRSWIASGAKFDGENGSVPLALVIPPPRYADPPQSYGRAVPITAVLFSPDGSQIVASGYHELTVWNAHDGNLVRRIGNIGQRVFALAFTADGQTLAVGCGEPGRSGEVRLVDFETGQVKTVIARSGDVVLDVAFRPQSAELAVAMTDGAIRLFNVDSLEEIRTIASHADWVTDLAWNADGSRLASASRDKSAKVYDGSSGELLSSYLGHAAAVRGVAFLPDGKQVVSVGADNKLHRWNIEGASLVAEVQLGGEAYKLTQADDFVLVPCADRRMLRIALSDNAISQAYEGHADWVVSAALEQSGVQAVSGSLDGEVRLWNTSDGSLVRAWIAKP